MREKMGLIRTEGSIRNEGNKQIFKPMSRDEAKRFLAAKGGKS